MEVTDSEKLNLILQLLSDMYEVLERLAPLAGTRMTAPAALERWRRELAAQATPSPQVRGLSADVPRSEP